MVEAPVCEIRSPRMKPTFVLALVVALPIGPAWARSSTRASRAVDNATFHRTLTSLGFDKYAGIEPFRSTPLAGAWTAYHFDSADCQCIDGAPYSILLRPGVLSDMTLIWLDGGGACWPGQDECTKTVAIDEAGLNSGLASNERSNPVRGWNIVRDTREHRARSARPTAP